MAFTPKKKEISSAIAGTLEKELSNNSLNISRIELSRKLNEDKVVTTYKFKERNKKKLERLAKINGYKTSTSAFLDDLIENIPE